MPEQDKHETKVVFRMEKYDGAEHVLAVFPDDRHSDKLPLSCYAHIGQHSGCSLGYYWKTRPATPEEFAGLKTELESIGYKLNIRKRR